MTRRILLQRLPRLPWVAGVVMAVAALVLLNPRGEARADLDVECAPVSSGCQCPPTYSESKVQPGFNDSGLTKIEATIGKASPGCCLVTASEGQPGCADELCSWEQITVKVTPNGACTIRTVTGKKKGAPMTINGAVEIAVEQHKVGCDGKASPAFKIQYQSQTGAWVDVYELGLICGSCSANSDSDG